MLDDEGFTTPMLRAEVAARSDKDPVAQHEAGHEADAELGAGVEVDSCCAEAYPLLLELRRSVIAPAGASEEALYDRPVHADAIFRATDDFIPIGVELVSHLDLTLRPINPQVPPDYGLAMSERVKRILEELSDR